MWDWFFERVAAMVGPALDAFGFTSSPPIEENGVFEIEMVEWTERNFPYIPHPRIIDGKPMKKVCKGVR